MNCTCDASAHPHRFVVLTGGPGAGKTAALEVVRRSLCHHVRILPEAAGILFGGGFPRDGSRAALRAGQRAIFHVQSELERLTREAHAAALVLCDRGTVDGEAYWPGPPGEFWREVDSSRAAEHARYAAVIHLRTPAAGNYNHQNPLRVESAAEASAVDERIAVAWRDHPRYLVVDRTAHFIDKLARAVALIQAEVPACCRDHLHAPGAAPA